MKRVAVVLLSVALVFCLSVGIVSATLSFERVDTAFVQRTITALGSGEYPDNGKYDYTYVDAEGTVIFETVATDPQTLRVRVNDAFARGDLVVDCQGGKVIFYLRAQERFEGMVGQVRALLWSCAGLIVLLLGCYGIWLYRRIFYPFNRLQEFADRVAAGDLDLPLKMDRYHSFGAFQEAFDIMRHNLKNSRRNEMRAQEDKKMMMSEIGHDIKTPLASIKAVAECGQARTQDKSFGIIMDKCNQIDALVSDIYRQTLDELGQLDVFVSNHSIDELAGLIGESDYQGKIYWSGALPQGAVRYDALRLKEVADNVVSNSYKYADTEIEASVWTEGDTLYLKLKDFGRGVDDTQIAYVTGKFWRGEKTKEKVGQGLGLFIARKLVQRMGGELTCSNENGFAVTISLPFES